MRWNSLTMDLVQTPYKPRGIEITQLPHVNLMGVWLAKTLRLRFKEQGYWS